MKISVVTTLYESERTLSEFHSRISQTINKNSEYIYELLFVNDGSTDNTLKIAKDILERDERVVIVDLSRNFGHHRAIMTGLEHSTGDLIFLIDSDLEEMPEDLEVFLKKMEEDSSLDVIYGAQTKRKGNLSERFFGRVFYKVFNLLSDEAIIPINSSTIRIMKRKYVDAILAFKDKEIYFTPLASLTGFNQSQLSIKKEDKGWSTYTFLKKYHLFINLIFSYTTKPLFFMFYTGLLITLMSSAYILYLLLAYSLYGIEVSGWASTIVSIWFFGGLTILFLGIISIYISKIYNETKNRPLFLVKDIWKK